MSISAHSYKLCWLLLAGLLTSCSAEPAKLHIYAASSLSNAFTELADIFEKEVPDAHIALSFAGSQVLRFQIENGAPAHIFASANKEHIENLAGAGLLRDPVDFATNELALVVPKDNPSHLSSFADIGRAQRIVIADDSVPAGRYTNQLFQNVGLDLTAAIVSKEINVRMVRSKVELREADAAIVYQSDINENVMAIPIPPSVNVIADYQMGIIQPSSLAERWTQFVLSARGLEILRRHGFGGPR